MEPKIIICIFLIVFSCVALVGIKYTELFEDNLEKADSKMISLSNDEKENNIYVSKVKASQGVTVGDSKIDKDGNTVTKNLEADVVTGNDMYSRTVHADTISSSKDITTTDLYTNKICIGNVCLDKDDFDQLANTNVSRLAMQRSDIFEFPPRDIEYSKWRKDMNDTIVGIGGITYAKYKAYIDNVHPYGGGEYIAWTNSIWDYRHTENMYMWEWPPSGAFDKKPGGSGLNTGWHIHHYQGYVNMNSILREPFYLAIKLPRKILLRKYILQTRGDGCCPEQMPSMWTIEGSNDNNSWVVLDRKNNAGGWSNASEKEFIVNTTDEMFDHFRIVIYRNNSPWNNYVHIGEWRLFGSIA